MRRGSPEVSLWTDRLDPNGQGLDQLKPATRRFLTSIRSASIYWDHRPQLSELVTTLAARVRPCRQPSGQRAAHPMTAAPVMTRDSRQNRGGSEIKSSTRRSMPGPQSNSLHSKEPKQLRKHRRKCHNEQLQGTRHHCWIGYHDLRNWTRRASALCGCSRLSGGRNVPGLDYSLHLSCRSCPHPPTARIRHVD
jgi:hypothetical protein